MTKRWLIVLFSVAAVLRLGFIWAAPAWYDEAFTQVVSRLPFERMLVAVTGDVHPPLWYLLLWPLGQLQAPIWVLRIPAALLSIFSVGIFWSILGALELSPRVRTAALVLMVIMPIQLYYAQEARMYALLEFLVLAAVLAMLRRKWFWFWLASVLMLYTQYYGFFYLATLYLVALNFNEHKQWPKIFLAFLLALWAFIPWGLVLKSQMSILSGSYWMQLTGSGMVLRVLFDALYMPPQNAVLQIPLMLAGFGWLIVAIGYALVKRNKVTGLVSLIAFCPFLFAVLFSLIWQPILHYRPLIAVTPFLYILLAGPIDILFAPPVNDLRLWIYMLYAFHGLNLRRAVFASVFLLPLLLICDGNILANTPKNKASGAAVELAYVQAHWQPGDILYHFSDDSWVLTAGNPLPNYKAPDCAPTLGALSPATRAAIGEQIAPLSSLQYKRAWLIWSDGPLNPACSRTQLTALGLDPDKPLLLTQDDEYVYEGLWMVEK
jgi:hypothetical protein